MSKLIKGGNNYGQNGRCLRSCWCMVRSKQIFICNQKCVPKLHVKQSIDVTTVPYKPYDLAKQVEETIENGTRKELVSSNYLTLNKYDMTGYNKVKNDQPFQLVSIIEGQGTVEGKEVKKGDHFVVCSDQKEVDFDGTMTVMICTL